MSILFKKKKANKVQENIKSDKSWMSPSGRFLSENTNYIRKLENNMILQFPSPPLHPDKRIKIIENCITSYFELKDFCSKSEDGQIYFNEMWQHCHNSKNNDFDFLDTLQFSLKEAHKDYNNLLLQYNKQQEVYDAIDQSEFTTKRSKNDNYNYVRVDDRETKYHNSTNTYLSNIGKKCVNYETKFLFRVSNYTDKICPNCNNEIDKLPKKKGTCPVCKSKIFIVDGYIKQGKFVLLETEFNEISLLRKKFNADKTVNPNYEQGVIVK